MQLDLEEALTRKSGSAYYNLGCHMLWIGNPYADPTPTTPNPYCGRRRTSSQQRGAWM